MSLSSPELMGIPQELYHWLPGEMVVVVRLPRLPAEETLETLAEQVRTRLNTFLDPYNLALEPYGTHGRWNNTPTMPPVRRRAFLFALHRKQPLLALFLHTRFLDPQGSVDPLPIALSYIQAHLEHLSQLGLHIVSAMPNWLVTAAPLFFGAGGPAHPPHLAPSLEISAPANSLFGWRVRLLDEHIPLDTRGAEDVTVAVLDTAPHPDRLRTAAARPELRRNWLLQRLAVDLRSDDGSFDIEYDRYPLTDDVTAGRGRDGAARYYAMSDHGLAVAGLIRDIAPRARIRLIRILNDYGGGDLYGLFAALSDLEREIVSGNIRRLVINLSLTIMPDIRRLPYIWFDHRHWPTTQLGGAIRVLNHIEEGLRILFESLFAHGVLIVAAAGNDSAQANQSGQPLRPPRAPARYESTIGVTSVNSSFAPSNFANAANLPPYDAGVATFGGDGYGALDGNTLPDAVRGLYISPVFPTAEPNLTGWADWCGTSFSTAMISGLGAHLVAQGWSAANSILRLSGSQERQSDQLFGDPPQAPHLLADIIRIQQKFGL